MWLWWGCLVHYGGSFNTSFDITLSHPSPSIGGRCQGGVHSQNTSFSKTVVCIGLNFVCGITFKICKYTHKSIVGMCAKSHEYKIRSAKLRGHIFSPNMRMTMEGYCKTGQRAAVLARVGNIKAKGILRQIPIWWHGIWNTFADTFILGHSVYIFL